MHNHPELPPEDRREPAPEKSFDEHAPIDEVVLPRIDTVALARRLGSSRMVFGYGAVFAGEFGFRVSDHKEPVSCMDPYERLRLETPLNSKDLDVASPVEGGIEVLKEVFADLALLSQHAKHDLRVLCNGHLFRIPEGIEGDRDALSEQVTALYLESLASEYRNLGALVNETTYVHYQASVNSGRYLAQYLGESVEMECQV
ncbi:MAG: hypothetical protein KDD70_17770, partial [Bdellovibrionales bacterium]|nr:hypothetical protein [Bdellovibrionales bacterium]